MSAPSTPPNPPAPPSPPPTALPPPPRVARSGSGDAVPDAVRRHFPRLAAWAELAAAAGLPGRDGEPITAPEAAMKIAKGAEFGLPPLASLEAFDMIQGGVAASAAFVAHLFRTSEKYDYHLARLDDDACTIEVILIATGEVIGVSDFNVEDAKKAGLLGRKSAMYQKYRRNMLFSRAIVNAQRWHAPDLLRGFKPYDEDDLVNIPTAILDDPSPDERGEVNDRGMIDDEPPEELGREPDVRSVAVPPVPFDDDEPVGPDSFGGTDEGSHLMAQTAAADLAPPREDTGQDDGIGGESSGGRDDADPEARPVEPEDDEPLVAARELTPIERAMAAGAAGRRIDLEPICTPDDIADRLGLDQASLASTIIAAGADDVVGDPAGPYAPDAICRLLHALAIGRGDLANHDWMKVWTALGVPLERGATITGRQARAFVALMPARK